MDHADDIYADDDFDLVGILEEAEMEYNSRQRQSSTIDNNNNPASSIVNMNANTTSHTDTDQSMPHTSADTRADTRSNWEEMRETPDNYGTDEQAPEVGAITGSTVEYMEYNRIQDMDLENALRDAARLRPELSFTNQELETKNAEIRDIRGSLQLDMMDVDRPSPGPSNTPSIQRRGQRTSSFPTRFDFAARNTYKRPRISSSPSPAPVNPAVSHLAPPPPPSQRQQRQVEQPVFEQSAFDQAVDTKVAHQISGIKHELEQQRILAKEQDVKAFLQCLNEVGYVKEHRDKATPPSSLELYEIVADGLRPPPVLKDFELTVNVLAHDTLNVLANDISLCISQVSTHGVEATLMYIFFLLRGVIKLCVTDHKEMTFVRTVDLLNIISTHYTSFVTTQLRQEVTGAGDQSIVHYLAKGLLIIPLRDASEGPSMHPFIQGIPGIADMNYSQIKAFLHIYTFGLSDIREILTGVSSEQCQETTSKVLKILNMAGPSDRFLFLLNQKGFTDIFSSQKPLEVVAEAIHLISALLISASAGWLRNEKYRTLLKTISSFMILPRPSDDMEVKWYRLKIASIQLFSKILQITPASLSPIDILDLALTPAMYTINNEYIRIIEGMKRPFVSVPSNESEALLADTFSLMVKTLQVHPVLFEHAYMSVLSSVKGFAKSLDKSGEHGARPALIKLVQLLKQKAPIV